MLFTNVPLPTPLFFSFLSSVARDLQNLYFPPHLIPPSPPPLPNLSIRTAQHPTTFPSEHSPQSQVNHKTKLPNPQNTSVDPVDHSSTYVRNIRIRSQSLHLNQHERSNRRDIMSCGGGGGGGLGVGIQSSG